MSRRALLALTLVAALLGGAACARTTTNTNTTVNVNSVQSANTSTDNTNVNTNTSTNTTTNTAQSGTNTSAPKPARLVDYSPSALAEAHQYGKVVLWFHAAWCPICRAIERDLNAGELATLPDGVTLLKVDFDTATDLRQQYGVVYQYTFVQVDAAGAKQKLWSATSVQAVRDGIL